MPKLANGAKCWHMVPDGSKKRIFLRIFGQKFGFYKKHLQKERMYSETIPIPILTCSYPLTHSYPLLPALTRSTFLELSWSFLTCSDALLFSFLLIIYLTYNKNAFVPKMTIMATFLGFYHFIPLGHKRKVWSHKKSPLALKSLFLKPKQNIDPELENQLISKLCYLNMGDIWFWLAVRIQPRYVDSWIFV